MDMLPQAAASRNGRSPLPIAAAIDKAIERGLATAKIPASPIADDAEFLRRVYLDLIGKVPTTEEAVSFLDSRDPAKRSKLIDDLLARDDHGKHLAYTWRDLLIKRDPDNVNLPHQEEFITWLAAQVNENRPWNEIVRAMLTAKGPEAEAGPTLFVMANQDMNKAAPNKMAGTAAALFMGIQLQCAECHNHPIVKEWSQQDFWGVAAFFARTRITRDAGMKGKPEIGTGVVVEAAKAPEPPAKKPQQKGKKEAPAAKETRPGVIAIPDPTNPDRTVGTARARFFGDKAPVSLPLIGEHRPVLADWMTSPRNPYFARATVNRLWAHFFARGFINPLDDIRPDSDVSHPELLALLTQEFTTSNFDVKHLFRCICNSKAYQRTSRPSPENEADETLLSHVPVKVLTARMLLDSLAVAVGQRYDRGNDRGGGKKRPADRGAVGFFDTQDYDELPSEYTYGIPQVLRLMNSQLNRVCEETARKVAGDSRRERAVERLYLLAMARRPTEAEVQRMTAFVDQAPTPVKGYAGVLWALLNSAEFVCNR